MEPVFKSRVVVRLSDAFATALEKESLHYTADPALKPLKETLARHKADLSNQLRDFEYYVESSEAHGVSDTPMVNWTRDAAQNPYAKGKYSKLFVVSVAGRKVFDTGFAQELATDLGRLAGQGVVEAVKVDSMDPAKNPAIPARYFGK